ncbi:MAG: hypothetical protein R2698_06695 [Microthrixaceae bacterium]
MDVASPTQRWPARVLSGIDWDAPFSRLALCHVLTVAGETLVVISLAGSFFFKVDPAQGREKVILGLCFTMAPFAMVGPFIGPMVDRIRGGHRAAIRLTNAVRVVVALAMTIAVINRSLALYVEAFAMLVGAKTYQVARAAVVPTTVVGEVELVEANSRLQVLAALAAIVAGPVGGLALLVGPEWVLAVTTLTFVAATVAAIRLHPSTQGALDEHTASHPAIDPVPYTSSPPSEGPDGEAARRGLIGHGLAVSQFAMALLRGVVGFVTLLLAFELRGGVGVSDADRAAFTAARIYSHFDVRVNVDPPGAAPPPWWFGVVITVTVLGGLVGAAAASALRRRFPEERLLGIAGATAMLTGVVAFLGSGLAAFTVLSFGVAVAAALGKQAFDASVQREIPEIARCRVFARAESIFQVVWVVGALTTSILVVPARVGAAVVIVVAGMAVAAIVTSSKPTVVLRRGDGLGVRVYLSRSGKSGTSNEPSNSGRT